MSSRFFAFAAGLLFATAAAAADTDVAYLFSYFSDKRAGGRSGQAAGLHLAYSYDGLRWTALNNDQPLLVPQVGKERLMRDPSICQGPDGTFHLVWTSGWHDRIIAYSSSKDLVHWTEQRAIPVMEHEPTARNCWAPELTYDPDDGLFYIYWSTTIPGRHSPIGGSDKTENGLNHRIYLTTTKDFRQFSPTKLWFNPDFSAIDAAVIRDTVKRDWIMIVKNENHSPPEKNLRVTRTDSLAKGFPTDVSPSISPAWVEGPSPLFVGDRLYVYFDCYRKHRYGAVCSDDRGQTWRDVSSEISFPEGTRHGTAFTVSRKFVDDLVARLNPAKPAKVGWELTATGLRATVGDQVRTLDFYGPNAIRVRTNLGTDYWKHPSLSVIAKPQAPDFIVREKSGRVVLVGPAFSAALDLATGAIEFLDGERHLLGEPANAVSLRKHEVEGDPTYEAVQRWTLSPDEVLCGLGQSAAEDVKSSAGAKFYGITGDTNHVVRTSTAATDLPNANLRGRCVMLVQCNIPAYSPVWSSSRGYAILWDVASKSVFIDSPEEGLSITGESAPGGSDYYFLYGPDPDDRFAAYRTLTGATPMFAKACLGYFQSKERYKSDADLTHVITHCRQAGFPIDWIVQDWQYWPGESFNGYWNGMEWDSTRFPDPKAMCDRFHNEYHVKLLVSVWPHIGEHTELGQKMRAEGLLWKNPLQWVSRKANAYAYDAYSPRAAEIYFDYVRRGFLDIGVDGLWMDATEVEGFGSSHPWQNIYRSAQAQGRCYLGDTLRYLNTYALATAKVAYEGQRATSDRRVFTLTRSAWAGLQRYGAISWSGDTIASWQRLRNEIASGISSSMSGLAWWTQDTGGFFCGKYKKGIKDPDYRELLARWNQFAIFNPVYRWHGTGVAGKKEPWIQPEPYPESYKSYLTAAKIRYRLVPYLYALMRDTHETGRPFVRPVWLDYPETPNAFACEDELCLGRSIYAAVVVEPGGGTNRVVRLPRGADWYDWWDNSPHQGGETIRRQWPIDRFPLYVKAGTILPLAPFKLYVDQPTEEPDEIRVYVGGDAEFTLYDDDHDTYAYERGEFCKIPLRWCDAKHTLTIGALQGGYPSMPATRRFKLIVVTPECVKDLGVVTYDGHEIVRQL